MSDRNYRVVLSHVFLAGVGIYCLVQVKDNQFYPPHVTFGVIAVNNILAVCCGDPELDNGSTQQLYKVTSYCQLLFALPCITTTVWLNNGYPSNWSWAWTVMPVFPLMFYVVNEDVDMPLADLLILFNLVGLGAVCIVKELKYGIIATACYALSHCTMQHSPLYNYGLACFSYFALRAIGYGHDVLEQIKM